MKDGSSAKAAGFGSPHFSWRQEFATLARAEVVPMRVLTIAVVILMASGVGLAENVDAAVRAVLQAQVEAWNHHDLAGFMAGYWNSPELTFFSGATETHGWQPTLERYRNRYQAEGRAMGTLSFSESASGGAGQTGGAGSGQVPAGDAGWQAAARSVYPDLPQVFRRVEDCARPHLLGVKEGSSHPFRQRKAERMGHPARLYIQLVIAAPRPGCRIQLSPNRAFPPRGEARSGGIR